MNSANEHDELKDAPMLRSIPKVDPFVVPDGFFDRFPHQVQARVAQRTSLVERIGTWLRSFSWPVQLAGIATIALLIAGPLYFVLRPASITEGNGVATIDVAPNELDPYTLDETDLYTAIDDAPALMAAVGDGFTPDEMAAYLEHEELPLDLLIEEL